MDRSTIRMGPTVDEADAVERETIAEDRPWIRGDRVRWGPVVAGFVTVIATMVILTVLGLAIGLSAFEPDEAGGTTAGTAAAIWGIVTALVAFFAGGWLAARTAAVGGFASGTLNGFVVGVAAIAVTVWLVGTGLGNILGAAAENVSTIASVSFSADPQNAFDEARTSAWATFAALLLALVASTAGGALGHRRDDQK